MEILQQTDIKREKSFEIKDSLQALSFKKNPSPNFRYIMHKISGGGGSESYTDMEYDLSESARIIDTESFVSAAFRKKRQLILKNGFEIVSDDSRNLEYVLQRLEEFEFVTSTTFRDFLSEVVENLVNFNNCFILKYRKEENSSGMIRSLPSGKEFKPISGLYVLAAPTIDTAINPKSGRIIRYRHRISDEYSKQFRPEDIFHIYENKRVGMTVGTPPLEATKDDIVMLRSIEQDTENLIHRHSNPLMQIQVGSDKSPARMLEDGVSEVDLYADIIDRLPEEGGVSTPHRVKINMIGAESQALRLESYLEYFKRRVLNGLSISEIDLGGSIGNSGSSEVASQSLKEEVRSYQEVISNFFTDQIFNEILLESPFYSSQYIVPKAERVRLRFTEPDLDKKIKIESHYMQMYISGLISQESALQHLGFKIEEKGIGVGKEGNSGMNSVKAEISNNIIEPKNQHNIQDSLFTPSFERYKPAVEYSRDSFDSFLEDVYKVIPSEIVLENISVLEKIYQKYKESLKDYGEVFGVKYVENALIDLLI